MDARIPPSAPVHRAGGRWAAIATAAVLLIAAACAGDGPDQALSPEAAEGRRLYNSNGCAGCHGTDGRGGVGPAMVGLAGSERTLIDGTVVVADNEYLMRAIMEPNAEIVAGYSLRMPSNRLDLDQVNAVIAYIEAFDS